MALTTLSSLKALNRMTMPISRAAMAVWTRIRVRFNVRSSLSFVPYISTMNDVVMAMRAELADENADAIIPSMKKMATEYER